MNKNVAIPIIAALVLVLAVSLLLHQKNAQMVPGPSGAPAPRVQAPAPTGPPPQGGEVRSIDKLNGYAAKVGCPVLVPDDPAGKLIDVAECLGAKAVGKLPAGQK